MPIAIGIPPSQLPLKMRLLHQALTVFLASLLLDTAAAEPFCYEGSTRPDPNECAVYHICDLGKFQRTRCPPGQAYSVLTGDCVPEWRSPGCRAGHRVYQEGDLPDNINWP
ncbi:hypothetical protein BO86DRAFT_410153 [Aspergillus japonicus CBS 114.51]|uniref:Chitin-binding type-2 domain-containing protein n=2 Tax=Aspergillus TaxID=5052 RepID=A0A2V5GSQ0_ASPV1|nr:hypothetical protein BO86DRAFT_410153 [Aspergillus japonicus CBS 114.51]PYI14305.1 hypothetical protein BO99DRAFT_447003 [Aspergillus violaceofuscus CBS 115571]RAH81307.1 hypothetical protein BO86DRAFT_410153 [Aspergillus japonicus CBS 114.51]